MRICICLATLLLGLTWQCLANAAAPATGSKSTLWSVRGRENTVYLLGSMHVLRASDSLSQAIEAAYQDAESLLMELDMDNLDPVATQQLILELGMLPAEQTLQGQLDAASYAKVAAYARSMGLQERDLNRFQPWYAAFVLTQLNFLKLGFDAKSGVEMRLTTRAVRDRKEIRGLETPAEQFGLLAKLPPEFLLYSVEDSERLSSDMDKLVGAWREGDVKSLYALASAAFDKYPELYRPLTVERNRKWLGPIEGLLDDKQDYLVVVGALHLVGKDSVLELLQKKGYKIQQQ